VFALIAVGVDGYPEGRDAAALAAAIGSATDAELLLVAVHPDPVVSVPVPPELGWTALHKHGEAMLRQLRDAVAPRARIAIETDWSVARALERVARREHRDLLVLGSSRGAPEGSVRIGNRTRQLLSDAPCAVAVAPRGFGARPARPFGTVGVGYDGGPDALRALHSAAALATAAGAKLRVRAVLDDQLPSVGWLHEDRAGVQAMWDEMLDPQARSLRDATQRAVSATGADAEIDVRFGGPAGSLIELSGEVDLLIVGSRRWGPDARVLLGSTGETLMHQASCPVIVVPRHGASQSRRS
jgi:nucleotide-binding universal stress UspA family protein